MTSSLEDYLRREVLPSSSIRNAQRDSDEFFEALKTAATVQDCVVPGNPLHIEKRSRYVWDSETNDCKATVLGLTLPGDLDELNVKCPAEICLGISCPQVFFQSFLFSFFSFLFFFPLLLFN